MDLYEDLVVEVLYSDVSNKSWREFEAKYLPLASRQDLFVQFTNFASSVDDKRLVGSLVGKAEEPKVPFSISQGKFTNLARAIPDKTLWTKPQHEDPTAIYTYPLDYVVNHPMDLRYGFPSRYMRVIKLKPGSKVLDLQTMTKEHAIQVLKAMGIIPPDKWDWETFWQKGIEFARPKMAGSPITAVKIFFFLAQHEFQYVHPADEFPFPLALDHNAQRARFMRAKIGVVQDTAKAKTDAVIHPNEPEQAFFMSRGDFEIVDVYHIAGKEGDTDINKRYEPVNYQHAVMKSAAKLLQSIDQKDRILGMKQIYGGYESAANPFPVDGHVNISADHVVYTKRGRAIIADPKVTGKSSDHRSEGRHIPWTIGLELHSEAGHQKTKIGQEDELSAGVERIATEYRKAKIDPEWKRFHGVDHRAEKWRYMLRALRMTGESTVDLDALKQASGLVCDHLAELFKVTGWNWKPPEDVWLKIACWHVADDFYQHMNRVGPSQYYEEIKKRGDKLVSDLEHAGSNHPMTQNELKSLKGTPVYKAALNLAEGLGIIKPSSEVMHAAWGMSHLFLKFPLAMTEGSFSNFRKEIAKELFTLTEMCKQYDLLLKMRWKDLMSQDRVRDGQARFQWAVGEFKKLTGSDPTHEVIGEAVNEVLIARPDSVGTATGLQLGSKEVWRNPSKQAAFISPQKQLPQTRNHYIAAGKRAVEKAVQRTLTWIRDPSTKSETAYIGHGRKVRVGLDNPSLSPMTIKINAMKLPSLEKLRELIR